MIRSRLLALALICVVSDGEVLAADGEHIYKDLCASCHGSQGQGVAGKYDETLHGNRSLESLIGYIDRNMPENDPDLCRGEDARAVAEYIYRSFYSPDARARLVPARVELSRLTNRQFRESVADLAASFTRRTPATKSGGLQAEYFQSDGMNKKAKKAFAREDASIAFDFGTNSPGEGITADQFSIAWHGSLLAPDTGMYDLRLHTPNGARLYVNSDLRAGDANLRDDSDARRHSAGIDLWVSSGGEPREASTRVFLLGGRSYPLRIDYFKYKETNAFLKFSWKPPAGEWEIVPSRNLCPEPSSALVVVTRPFPPDDASLGYERGAAVSRTWQDAAAQGAIEAANQMVARLAPLSGVGEDDTNRPARLQEFAAKVAERAFRRPLTSLQQEQYVKRHFQPNLALEIAVKRGLLSILCSPQFLYPELFERNDSYSVAARLALHLWDSLPDQQLLKAAAQDKLNTREQAAEQTGRMLKDPRAKAKLREFFHHWLRMEEGEDLSKDPEAFPGFDKALVADLRHSLEEFIEHVVWSEQSDYRQLLLANYVYLNPRLASFYGVEGVADGEFKPSDALAGPRYGVLTHPYVLSMLSYHRSTSPIHRGVFLTRNILGRFLKPPPMAISFMDDRFDPSLTMREKVTELTKAETCMACHVTINPLGFSLENYDAIGRWREKDNSKPVISESDYATPAGDMIRLRGPREVAEHAASSQEARLGFVRQLFQYTVKQAPAAYGPDTLVKLHDAFSESECNIVKLFQEICILAAMHKPLSNTQASQ